MNGDDAADWGISEHLEALIADAVRLMNWQWSGDDKSEPQPAPKPIARPGVDMTDARESRARTEAERFRRRAAERASQLKT